MNNFLGIDWGGTYIKIGVTDDKGKLLKQEVLVSQNFKKKQVFVDQIDKIVKDLKSFKIKGVGIGAPGLVDIKKGQIYYLPNIPGWKNFPLGQTLKKKLKIPVFIDNDANIFGLAEARLGAAKGKKRVLFFTLGTGLGSAVIANGQVLEGNVSAAELGHVPISVTGRKCGCGGTGCIETYIGNRYIIETYKSLKSGLKEDVTVKQVYERALAGEKQAIAVWREFSQVFGKFLAGMINIFNPEVIVLGGGVSGAFKVFKPFLWETIKKQAMWPNLEGLKLVKAKLNNPGIIGAALLAKEKLNIKLK